MNLALAILVTLFSVVAGTGLCFYVLYQVREVETTTWIVEHVACPIIRILVLLIVVSQVYPVIDEHLGSLDFWRILGHQDQFRDMINILFFAGLLLGFLPLVGHPVFALPLQGMLTIALVFDWQYAEVEAELLPSLATLAKIVVYMLLAWYATRELSGPLARRLDHSFHIHGSIRLVSDALYMVLQIPVMLIYCGYLNAQLA